MAEEGSLDKRKRISGGKYKANRRSKDNPFAVMSDEEQRVEALKRQKALNKKRAEEQLDQDPERNKQLEDMRQGDFLQDPEQPTAFSYRNMLKILQAVPKYGGVAIGSYLLK